jgi:hypothetical protein
MEETVSATTEGRPARRRWIGALLAAVVLTAAAGVVAGRATAPGRQAGDTPGGALTPAGGGQGGSSRPCPAGHDSAGAARAAACLAVLLYQLEGTPAATMQDRLRAASIDDAAAARLGAMVSRGVAAGGRAAAGVLTEHVDIYTDPAAQVFLWMAIVRSATPGSPDSDALVDPEWTSEAVSVMWSQDRWKLAAVIRTDTTPPSGAPKLGRDWQEPSYVD